MSTTHRPLEVTEHTLGLLADLAKLELARLVEATGKATLTQNEQVALTVQALRNVADKVATDTGADRAQVAALALQGLQA